EPARKRDQQRVQAGGAEEPEIDTAPLVQLKPARLLTPSPQSPGEEERDERPAEPEQEPIAPGHVRRGVARVLRDVASAPAEVEVDGVLGQHSDYREDRGGQVPGDVVLRRLRCP